MTTRRIGVTPVVDDTQRLVTVVIGSHHGQEVRLLPDQASALQEQIGQIRTICQGPHCADLCGTLSTALSRHEFGPSGVAAWPMCIRDGAAYKGLGGIWIECQTDRQPPLKLTPDEIPEVARELTRIVLHYLHDVPWGGEDANRTKAQ